MKWFIYVVLFVYVLDQTDTVESTEDHDLILEPIDYGSEKTYYTAGVRKSIICKGVSKNQKVEWVDPSGKVVSRQAADRVFTQEHFIPSLKSRIPALVLIFTRALVEDTGTWTCRSGEARHEVPICVIDPAEFVNTPTELTVDYGRSITLSCQAKGEPEPRILWYRNGEIITDESNSIKYKVMRKFSNEGFESLLTIISLDSEDSGVYICSAVQESPDVDRCLSDVHINITLHVNYQPTFEDGNDTSLVPGKENKSVDLVCSANGYPTPKYRWFKDVGDILTEYSKDDLKILEDGAKSVLTVTANESSFGKRFICRAANQYGVEEKVFELYKMGSPTKPNDIHVVNATHVELVIRLTWTGLIFPINELHIQYMEINDTVNNVQNLSDSDWSQSKNVVTKDVVLNRLEDVHSNVLVTLKDLDEETEYCIRASASNDVGVSPWSDIVTASTTDLEDDQIPEEAKREQVVAIQSGSAFYGIFFGCGIGLVAIAYMFAIRLV